jgi:2-polyprenyl-3-methyl-5-hydroxy-6-metoxy-1,4-benzoquinol methylase
MLDGAKTETPALVLPPGNPPAEARFRQLMHEAGMDVDHRFGGGYVLWEWDHGRHLFADLPVPMAGARVLELGCHLGATAVVMALLGAAVTAVDIEPTYVALTQANADRFGVGARVTSACIADTGRFDFGTGAFDVVSCNSVLEYVPHQRLPFLLGEIARVLRPGGLLVILGTSSRLWPRELHSGQWLSNYVPRWVDPLWPGPRLRRGLSPGEIRAGLPGFTDLLAREPERFVGFKRRVGGSPAKLAGIAAAARLAGAVGRSPGTLFPTLTMIMEAPGRRS